jgi:hypothetical protein
MRKTEYRDVHRLYFRGAFIRFTCIQTDITMR